MTLLSPPHHHHWPASPVQVAAFDESGVLTEDDLRCGYSSKKCTNVRTTKKGGGLHRFCEFHRRRANQNQWRVDDKRRAIRAQRRQLLKRARALTLPDPVGLLDAGATLTSEDIHVLCALLLGTSDSAARAPAAVQSPGQSPVEKATATAVFSPLHREDHGLDAESLRAVTPSILAAEESHYYPQCIV